MILVIIGVELLFHRSSRVAAASLSSPDSVVEERGSFVSLAEAAEYPTVETGVAAGDDVFLFEVRERSSKIFR